MTTLKICGLKPGDDTSFTAHPVVSHIGVIFVPTSKRFVEPEQASHFVRKLPDHCHAVGVFVDENEHSVLQSIDVSGVKGAQLHGTESPEMCESIQRHGYTVWKSFPVPLAADDAKEGLKQFLKSVEPYAGVVDALLLDAAPPKGALPGMTGGHGISYDWTILPKLLDGLQAFADVPIWIAGGITPENVQDLLAVCLPYGIDVSSGVEENGRKSNRRIYDMMKAVEMRG